MKTIISILIFSTSALAFQTNDGISRQKKENPTLGTYFAPGDCKRFVKKKYRYEEYKCNTKSPNCVPACRIHIK